jgi:trehalose 6-phosphate phosphatase
MKWLLARAQRSLLADLASAGPVLVFDFDGVLAPIETRPSLAGLRPRIRGLLGQLCRSYACAVISGRSLASLRARLRGIPFACLVGNHGSEWARPDPREARWRRLVRGWRGPLAGLTAVPGVEIEDKRLSLSVHYRRAPNRQVARRGILRACEGLEGARIVGGSCVVNVIPTGAIDKGRALRMICARLRRSTAFFLGDDVTDEDAFRLRGSWPGLLTARVGRSRASRAAYFLRRQEEVAELLELLSAAGPLRLDR